MHNSGGKRSHPDMPTDCDCTTPHSQWLFISTYRYRPFSGASHAPRLTCSLLRAVQAIQRIQSRREPSSADLRCLCASTYQVLWGSELHRLSSYCKIRYLMPRTKDAFVYCSRLTIFPFYSQKGLGFKEWKIYCCVFTRGTTVAIYLPWLRVAFSEPQDWLDTEY